MPRSARASTPEGDPPSRKGIKKQPGLKRTRTGCVTCRKKKHKCDEEKPSCARCVRSKLDCVWPTELPLEEQFQPYFSTRRSQTSNDLEPPTPSSTSFSSWSTGPTEAFPSTSTSSSSSPFSLPLQSSNESQLVQYGDDAPPWNDRTPPLYVSPATMLEVVFPDPEERSILQHFLVILPSLYSIGPFSRASQHGYSATHNPSVDRFIPALDCARFLSTPRGSSTANDALLLSLLSVGAIHLSSLHRQNAADAASRGDHALFQDALEKTQRYMSLSHNLERGSSALQNASILLLDPLNPVSTVEMEDNLDLILVAGSVATLTLCLAGSSGWESIIDLGMQIVSLRGGPVTMLENAKRTGDTKRLRRTRCMLEDLFNWDVFGSLQRGRASLTFTGSESTAWYFDYVPPSDGGNIYQMLAESQDDWETVECMLGLSRGIVEMLNRVNTLYANSRASRFSFADGAGLPLALFSEGGPASSWSSQAAGILIEADTWRTNTLSSLPEGTPPLLSRLQFGNVIYCYLVEILLKTDVLGVSQDDPSIQSAAQRVLELFEGCNREHGLVLGWALMWPLIIAGSVQPRDPPSTRQRFRAALDCLRICCCFDLDEAKRLLERAWALKDAGTGPTSWREAVRNEGTILM